MTPEFVFSPYLFDEFYFQKNVMTMKDFGKLKDPNSCNLEALT